MCSWGSRSSAAPSIVTMRWSSGMEPARAFSRGGLPGAGAPRDDDVPALGDSTGQQLADVDGARQCLERHRPGAEPADGGQGSSTANGGTTAFTPLPSGRRASRSDEDRSTRNPSGATTRSMSRRIVGSFERDRQPLQAAGPLHPHRTGAVDQHVGDRGVGEDGLQRTETVHVGKDSPRSSPDACRRRMAALLRRR